MAVAVVARDPATVPATLSAVRGQAYGPSRITIVGGDKAGRQTADENETEWVSNLGGLLGALDPEITHVWIVHGGAEPRPDALGALLSEAERDDVAAGIAGSKLLALEDPDRLVSVGFATDVFDAPFTGIDDGEIDHGQYDVVRDVAAVGGASMLVPARPVARPARPRPAARPDSGVHRLVPAGPPPGSTGRGGALVGGAGARRRTTGMA